MVTGISDRLLAARLRELQAEGLIERHVRATTPVTITYTPSTDGLRLIELLQPLTEWGSSTPRSSSGGRRDAEIEQRVRSDRGGRRTTCAVHAAAGHGARRPSRRTTR